MGLCIEFRHDRLCSRKGPAVATGIKRSRPQNLVQFYQGDGDLGAIGIAEIIHAANRGENFTTLFINNSIYGMTGANGTNYISGPKEYYLCNRPRSLVEGYPMNISEIIAQLQAPVYVARFAVNSPANINKAKAGIRKALRYRWRRRVLFC